MDLRDSAFALRPTISLLAPCVRSTWSAKGTLLLGADAMNVDKLSEMTPVSVQLTSVTSKLLDLRIRQFKYYGDKRSTVNRRRM